VLIAYCLPGEFAESGQEILGGFELEVLESYEVALPQDFMAWMMVIGNEDRQDRLPAAVGVICASDLNDVQTRVLSPEEQQEINNIVSQFTATTSIDQVINIINNVTTTPQNGNTTTNTTGGGGGDTTAPVLTVPNDNNVLETSDPGGGLALYTVTARDDVDGVAVIREGGVVEQDNVGGDIIINCGPPSQTRLPLGDHTIQCSATDAAGNEGTASFIYSIRGPASPASTDTTPPVFTADEAYKFSSAPGGGVALYAFTVHDDKDGGAYYRDDNVVEQDNVPGDIIITCGPPSGSFFQIGTTIIECTAVDSAGNIETGTFTMTLELADNNMNALAQEQPAPADGEDTTTTAPADGEDTTTTAPAATE
jgi:hypothetical protein